MFFNAAIVYITLIHTKHLLLLQGYLNCKVDIFFTAYIGKECMKIFPPFFLSVFQLNLTYQYLKKVNFTNTLMVISGGYQVKLSG